MPEPLEQAKQLITDFKKNVLDKNKQSFEKFSFLNLNRNTDYCKFPNINEAHRFLYGDYFTKHLKDGYIDYTDHHCLDDYDDMNIVRAINYVLYHDRLPNIVWDDFKWDYEGEKPFPKYYRGETINTFHTLINEWNYREYFKDIKNGDAIIAKIDDFLYDAFSIGNFMLLPNKTYGSFSLNKYKGTFYNDYFDLFLKVLKGELDDRYITKLIEKNKDIYDLADFDKFIKDNYLDDYISDGEININFFPHYRHYSQWDPIKDSDAKEKYAEFIGLYIDVATQRIKSRAKRICNALNDKLEKI